MIPRWLRCIRMNRFKFVFPALIILGLIAGIVFFFRSKHQEEKNLSFTILQMNDVYEIAPLAGTNEGGMARVATIRKNLLKDDPNTITVLAGDFLSPSFIGTLSYYDSVAGLQRRMAGKQMVDVMNALGVDYVTFGNHEFDIPVGDLQRRINESRFTWISSNVLQRSRRGLHPFIKYTASRQDTIMPYAIKEIHLPGEETFRVGFIGATLPFNLDDSIQYEDIYTSVRNTYDRISPLCDVVIALTHLDITMDSLLAVKVPELDLILGGHEHAHNYKTVGKVPISKADANAKSLYIHNITYYPYKKETIVSSELSFVNENIAADEQVDRVVNRWITFANERIRQMGYAPERKLMTATEPLNGKESEIRNHPTNYTALIANAILYATPSADAALFNSGSLRVDDELTGDITEYDVLRSLPFGGSLVLVKMKGTDLSRMLQTGTVQNKGSGGYLQLANASFSDGVGYIREKAIEPKRTYTILMPKFVALGKESNLDFVKDSPFTEPKVFRDSIKNSILDVVIAYMALAKVSAN
jgi:2',3'-cyclic-nucleotide 2'-phosphodiesterase (5'-nucleotidase family)